jgi:hypothetical protein
VVYTCLQCGQMQTDKQGVPVTEIEYFQKHRCFCSAQVSGWKVDANGRRVRAQDEDPVWETRLCGAPLFEYSRPAAGPSPNTSRTRRMGASRFS